ncbi:MAG: D-glycero-beta-D-manno-heptose-7-phosphate kinase [Candidatus Aceula meridiana]|nr:D-glycero-beta-D-manno-heptose-7-phosphate kinase [Candidatus Aceula meridiana]
MSHFNKIIASFKNKKILVVGDVILDQYIQGSVSRISPEAPVPVVLQDGHPHYTPGGSANVANNLSRLGAKVVLVGRVGQDREEKILKKELRRRKIDVRGLFIDKRIPTALKTRIIAQHQQLVRVDREDTRDLGPDGVNRKIFNFIEKKIDSFDAIIISDYGKGVVTKDLVTRVCKLAIQNKKIITVDPKVEHFHYYSKVTAITPNKNEAQNAIRDIIITQTKGRSLNIKKDKLQTLKDVQKAGKAILSHLKLESLLVTLGDEGMYLFEKGNEPFHIETKAKEVFDVSGAGDTVISVFTLSLASGATKREAAFLANCAAGVVVAKTGAVAVSPQEILNQL